MAGTAAEVDPAPTCGGSARSCARCWSTTSAPGCAPSWLERGASDAELGWIDDVLDPDVLTIGFARRVPTYKRLTLMLRDPDRLKALLLDPERPVQLIVAGKSHPADDGGKALIQQVVQFADDPEVRHRIVFLPDYDMSMARLLYWGCDVWLNNPLRPLEACGTSGMKSALNGGLNLSIRDGWWDEWYDGENGWAIPTADGVADADRRDDLEAAALYDLLEKSVARGSTTATPTACRRAGSRWSGTRCDARAEGAGVADGARLHRTSTTRRPPCRRVRSSRATRRWPRSSRPTRPRCARPGTASVWSTSRPPASATPRSAAPSSRCARTSRSATSPVTT